MTCWRYSLDIEEAGLQHDEGLSDCNLGSCIRSESYVGIVTL